ncbi:class I SAM-dependent methyltransferase [Ferruginibacter albus]|uniref:class I SAM-dependent methyltransferase n=1 Tax=Ferruginibacter albus TaxID=2875540 RepID=UPI001CC4E4A2|nr:class I SAM-dependent methyltransferase [Ferruginibacter albus]UAY50723.1 class I SAM-dependent methyltransferase [Ferruginibacter albus]
MIARIKTFIPAGLKKQIKLLLHKGNKYTCPFCNYSSKDLSIIGVNLPVLIEKQVVGGGERRGGCYNCDSTDRERLLLVYLKEKLNIASIAKEMNVLHIAPEKNLANILLKLDFKSYILGDLYTDGYSYPEYVQNMNVLNIPYDNNTFDLIICNHVLEHIPTDTDAMKELQRVLKPGGKAILQVPISKNTLKTFEDFSITDPKQREMLFGQYDHLRLYGQDYVQRLEQSGFKVNRINISSEFIKYGVNEDEELFICEKMP